MTQQSSDTSLEQFVQVLKQLIEAVTVLAGQEEQMAQAAALSQHHLISGFLNQEQAQLLKLRGLEQKRLRLASLMGWEDLTFQQILEQAETEQVSLLSPLFTYLNRQIKRLLSARDSADKAIRLRMRELDAAIGAMQGRNPDDVEFSRKNSPSHFQNKYV